MPAKKKKGKKILLGVLGAFLVVLLGVGIAAGAYFLNLSGKLSYDGDLGALSSVLTEADYQEPFYVLVIGSDNWEGYGARSDAMILTRVDLNKPQVTMVSVPRDTEYQIDGRTVKLNQVFAEQGEIACIEAVSKLTGVPIAHYVEVEFDQLQGVVDSLGGLHVNVPYTIDYQVYTNDRPSVHVEKGEQVINGEQAVALARMRTGYNTPDVAGGDVIRQANIRAMMIAMMKQILSAPLDQIPGQIETLSSMIQTDIPMGDLVSWALDLAKADEVTVYSCTGPTEGDMDADTGLWLTTYAPQEWAELMSVVDSGGDPATVVDKTSTSDGAVDLESKEVIDTGGN
ncbi:LCP family protein [Adlercreutzia sp. ZJ473]|uniref:LCP family protein n=1 Tax=Adlercreutzia sp. ZJ473 TaxID=2722822 RepID=UPI00155646E7|nr:LCP family protein [Adlercreutzia sp. ZJ473]